MSTAEIQPAAATFDVPELVVGFDLDMTLIDSRPGIQAVWDLLAAETGVPIDTDLVVSRLGPPLTWEMANWFPPEQVDAMVSRYREHYPSHAITGSLPLPGVLESLAADTGVARPDDGGLGEVHALGRAAPGPPRAGRRRAGR